MFLDEQGKLQEIGKKAMQLIDSGEFKKAERELKRLDSSWMVVESMQISIPLHALSLIKQNKKEEAKKYCLNNITNLWGDPELLGIIRQCNSALTVKSVLFKFRIKGGNALSSMFNDRHTVSVEAIADSQDEAFSFIQDLVQFSEPKKCKILKLEQATININEHDKKGVYSCSSFSI